MKKNTIIGISILGFLFVQIATVDVENHVSAESSEKFDLWNVEGIIKPPRVLVIHHTADSDHAEQSALVNASHKKRGYGESSLGSNIAYHFMVGKDGTVKQNRSLYERTMHTKNSVTNMESIAIVVNGNFEHEYITSEQLDAVHALIKRLDATFHFEEIIPHRESSPTACPGKNLLSQLDMFWREKERDDEVWYITRYYTPERGQLKYFRNTYEEDFAINCQGDCLVTANGHKLEAHEAFQVAACPPEIPFGTKIQIEGIGIVTCHDRGGAIKEKRIDIWAGIGMDALRRLKEMPGGYLSVKFL